MFSIYLVLFNKSIVKGNGILSTFSQARYLFLMMGIFAVYNGMIYNEFFALPVEAFWGSCFSKEVGTTPFGTKGYPPISDDCVYYFGVDSRWAQSSNNLTFLNSLKMKTAVILGVL